MLDAARGGRAAVKDFWDLGEKAAGEAMANGCQRTHVLIGSGLVAGERQDKKGGGGGSRRRQQVTGRGEARHCVALQHGPRPARWTMARRIVRIRTREAVRAGVRG